MIVKDAKQFKCLKNILKNKKSNYSCHLGMFAIQSLENGILTEKQIEVIKFFFKRKLKKKSSLYFFNKPIVPFTKRFKGQRMGAGKSKLHKFIYPIKKGTLLFVIDKMPNYEIKKICKCISYRLNFKIRHIDLIVTVPQESL